MEKSNLYLITVIILAITIIVVSGEYFSYKYYSLSAEQAQQQTITNSNIVPETTPSTTSSTQPDTTKNPTVKQQPSGSSEKSITSFDFDNPLAVGNINETNHTITLAVPPDTDVTKLSPTIEISNNATISPQSNSPQDFTNPVSYLVTAQDGSTQNYIVTVNVASVLGSIGNSITSFTLSGFNPIINGSIDNSAYTVYAVVPDGTDITKITPTIQVSYGTTISPKSGITQDFTNPVIYTVTDAYGGKQEYTIMVVTESNSG